ncbi:deoxyhypusine synthase family protein, partial [uncultured Maricaulis sp.]|uniref:deoxyhypusine synthase family protein n=1 Tax=uncultured Maricaulis sp. TaxID=174710 RepID=UPI0030D6CE75
MTDTSNRKAELLSSPVEHIDITAFDGRAMIDAWEKMSFTSRDAARAARILEQAVADPDCSVILTLAGSTSAGGCMHVWRDMVRNNMVDANVSTGSSIVDMDFFAAPGFKHYQAQELPDDRELREHYNDRNYDPYIDAEELQACDAAPPEIAH